MKRLAAVLLLVLLTAAPAAAAPLFPAKVKVEAGALEGAVEGEVVAWRSVPYAAPPVGDLRWRPPQPTVRWNGLREARALSPDCVQGRMPIQGAAPSGPQAEDCLYLNVWRPAATHKGERLPVLVWIHGGAFVNGGSSSPETFGDQLAKRGLVVVTFNYRLGRLGFFGHPALTAEHPDEAKGNYGLVLRQIPNQLFDLRAIGMPDKIKELLYRPRGLFLVTGPTGSGKSTTLASMVNYINENRDGHIITIEDPIEYYHQHKKCVVTQREVGSDVPSFSEAIRRALRQDPDVILVGELRDLETIEAAISAAETGHLVFGTLHTNSAAKTVDRIVDAFPANMKEMIRTQLSTSIIAVISQGLCKKKTGGRIAAYEIMVNTSSIASLIRDNKTFRIPSDIQTGAALGMITLDTHLMSLVNRELIEPDEALEKSQEPVAMREKLTSMGFKLRDV